MTTADFLYRSSDYNTPKSLYMDLVEACGRVGREEDVNGRAMAARQWVIEEVRSILKAIFTYTRDVHQAPHRCLVTALLIFAYGLSRR